MLKSVKVSKNVFWIFFFGFYFREEKINPDIVLFLGDSNSVSCSVSLKKEGYKIGHIEAGMRSYDKRMLEETFLCF